MTVKPLEIKNVTKEYGDFRAVSDLSFGLESGEILDFLVQMELVRQL